MAPPAPWKRGHHTCSCSHKRGRPLEHGVGLSAPPAPIPPPPPPPPSSLPPLLFFCPWRSRWWRVLALSLSTKDLDQLNPPSARHKCDLAEEMEPELFGRRDNKQSARRSYSPPPENLSGAARASGWERFNFHFYFFAPPPLCSLFPSINLLYLLLPSLVPGIFAPPLLPTPSWSLGPSRMQSRTRRTAAASERRQPGLGGDNTPAHTVNSQSPCLPSLTTHTYVPPFCQTHTHTHTLLWAGLKLGDRES